MRAPAGWCRWKANRRAFLQPCADGSPRGFRFVESPVSTGGPALPPQRPLGRFGAPAAWAGIVCGGGGSGYPTTDGNSAEPVSGACVGQLLPSTRGSARDGVGSDGTLVFGAAKLNAAVMSPVTDLRQAERFGTSAPKRVSRKRSVEVWSKVSEQTKPPREKGETTSIGTRKPRPIGPRIPFASSGSVPTVRYSPGVPGGATGGGTWSKKPPFSS